MSKMAAPDRALLPQEEESVEEMVYKTAVGRNLSKGLGLAFGDGLSENLREAFFRVVRARTKTGRKAKNLVPPDPLGPRHRSLKSGWWIGEMLPKNFAGKGWKIFADGSDWDPSAEPESAEN